MVCCFYVASLVNTVHTPDTPEPVSGQTRLLAGHCCSFEFSALSCQVSICASLSLSCLRVVILIAIVRRATTTSWVVSYRLVWALKWWSLFASVLQASKWLSKLTSRKRKEAEEVKRRETSVKCEILALMLPLFKQQLQQPLQTKPTRAATTCARVMVSHLRWPLSPAGQFKRATAS